LVLPIKVFQNKPFDPTTVPDPMPSADSIRSPWFRWLGLFLVVAFAGQTLYLTKAIRQNWLILSQRESESGPTHEETPGTLAVVVSVAEGSRFTRASTTSDSWPRRAVRFAGLEMRPPDRATFADEFLLSGPLGGRRMC
jgi:hypothetical protein